MDALAGIGANKHRNMDLAFFQTHQRLPSIYVRNRFFSTAGTSITSDPKTHVIRAAAASSASRSAVSGTLAGRAALLASNGTIHAGLTIKARRALKPESLAATCRSSLSRMRASSRELTRWTSDAESVTLTTWLKMSKNHNYVCPFCDGQKPENYHHYRY